MPKDRFEAGQAGGQAGERSAGAPRGYTNNLARLLSLPSNGRAQSVERLLLFVVWYGLLRDETTKFQVCRFWSFFGRLLVAGCCGFNFLTWNGTCCCPAYHVDPPSSRFATQPQGRCEPHQSSQQET